VYCRFLDIAGEYKEGADEWISRNRRLPAIVEAKALPVIVPYEMELTVQSRISPPSLEVVEPMAACSDETNAPVESEELNWSRPKQRNIFRRLTEAVGHFFGG
jgi:hypothetical protein